MSECGSVQDEGKVLRLDPLYLNQRRVINVVGSEVSNSALGGLAPFGSEKSQRYSELTVFAELLARWLMAQDGAITSFEGLWTRGTLEPGRIFTAHRDFYCSGVRQRQQTGGPNAWAKYPGMGPGGSELRLRLLLHAEHVVPGSPGDLLSGRVSDLFVVAQVQGVDTAAVEGFTAKGDYLWDRRRVRIECVGIPPFPRSSSPRVVGIIADHRHRSPGHTITYVRGNAASPRGGGARMILHVVNDATPNWGGTGFAQKVRSSWPSVQQSFRNWATSSRGALRLGAVHVANVDSDISVASLVCQKGYGPSPSPRIRYAALRDALRFVVEEAEKRKATIHMPRIGCGQAGGSWEVVRELVETTVCSADIAVTVYDPPGVDSGEPRQRGFDFAASPAQ